jgi:hypothetical protein
MKSSTFSKVFARHALSVLLVVSTALMIGNLAAAADGNDQPSKVGLHQKSARVAPDDNNGSSPWEHNLQIDRFDGARLVQAQWAPATACYTFAGPVCLMNYPIPQGSPCTCWGYLPGTAW